MSSRVALIVGLLLALTGGAAAQSTINTGQPATSGNLSSLVVRQLAQAAASDINGILGMHAASSLGGCPTTSYTGVDCLVTGATPAQWYKSYSGGWALLANWNLSTGAFGFPINAANLLQTAPITLGYNAGVATVGLGYASDFTVNGSNQLALVSAQPAAHSWLQAQSFGGNGVLFTNATSGQIAFAAQPGALGTTAFRLQPAENYVYPAQLVSGNNGGCTPGNVGAACYIQSAGVVNFSSPFFGNSTEACMIGDEDFTVSGTPTAGESPGFSWTVGGVTATITYTVQSGDTNTSIAQGIINALNNSATAASILNGICPDGVKAAAVGANGTAQWFGGSEGGVDVAWTADPNAPGNSWTAINSAHTTITVNPISTLFSSQEVSYQNVVPAVTFNGYISGTTLVVTGMTSTGGLNIGSAVNGTGVTSGTVIENFGASGCTPAGAGAAGCYTVNHSQTVGSSGSPAALTAPARAGLVDDYLPPQTLMVANNAAGNAAIYLEITGQIQSATAGSEASIWTWLNGNGGCGLEMGGTIAGGNLQMIPLQSSCGIQIGATAGISFVNGGVVVGNAVTGGNKGVGTVNAQGYYLNGAALATVTTVNSSLTLSGGTLGINEGHSNGWTIGQTVNATGGALGSPLTGALWQLANASGVATRYEADAYGAAGYFSAVAYGGSFSSPAALTSGTEMGGFNAWGYDGSAVSGPAGAFRVFANGTWSHGSSYPTYADIAATPGGSASEIEVAKFLATSTTAVSATIGASGSITGNLVLGAASGAATLAPPASGGGTATLFAGTDTIACLTCSQALTGKTYNGLTVSTTTGTLTIANGKTLTDTSSVGADLLLGTTGGGFAAYGGALCSNQFLTALSAAGGGTCGSVVNADLTAGTFSNITGVGTLTAGATGAGFTVALGTSTITGQLGLSNGGTNANLTASNGGIVWSNATQLQVLAGTATADQMLMSGTSTAPLWSTSTWPTDVSGAGQILNSTGAHTWSATATAAIGTSLAIGGASIGSNALAVTGTFAFSAGGSFGGALTGITTLAASTSLTSPTIYGGSAAGSILSLTSTSNGSPSGDSIKMTTGGSLRGTIATGGQWAIGANAPNSSIFMDVNANSSNAEIITTPTMRLAAANGSSTTLELDSFTTGNNITGLTAGGSLASPSNSASGKNQFLLAGYSYSGSSQVLSSAIAMQTAESGSTGAGSIIQFDTTALGSTTIGVAMTLKQGLIIGTGTTDPGIGNVQAGGWIGTGTTTIGGLPSCSSSLEGARYIVTNGVSSPTFGGTVSTIGSTVAPVTCNGSSWIYGELIPANDNWPLGLSRAA
jgi:hypothetical protein